MTTTSGDEADETLGFMRQFQQLLRRMQESLPDDGAPSGEPLEPLLSQHLGVPAAGLAVVMENVPPHRVVDADIALAQVAGEDPAARIVGLAGDMRHHMQLGDILSHGLRGPVRLGQVDYLQMDTGPGPEDRRQVVSSGLHLFHVDGRPVVVRVQGRNPQFGREQATMEVIAPERATSEALIGRLRELMDTLTTNRVEDLEVALAQRPGRVDLAAEIPLPDSAGRLALLRLYGGHLFGSEALATAAARSEGTTASFTKELVRRAVLTAAVADEPPRDEHLGVALDELMSDTERLTRSLLGVGADDLGAGPGMNGPGMMGGPPGVVMMGRGRSMSRGSFAYNPTTPG